MGLIKIGDVAKLCNISIKTIRYYETLDLIKPAEVDKYTGYRYYDNENLEYIYSILFLKYLNFSLAEIKNYSQDSLNKKFVDIKSQIKELNKILDLITSLKINKGDGYMKCFINDKEVIGKWKYLFSTQSMDDYENGDTFVENDALLKELYFYQMAKVIGL